MPRFFLKNRIYQRAKKSDFWERIYQRATNPIFWKNRISQLFINLMAAKMNLFC